MVTTLSGMLSGANSGLVKDGFGTLILSGTANNIAWNTGGSAAFTLNAGTLEFQGATAGFASAGSITALALDNIRINDGVLSLNPTTAATLEANRGVQLLGGGLRAINVAAGKAATIAGIVSETGGSAGLMKLGGGTLTLTGTNTFTGTTAINGGILAFGSGGLGSSGAIGFYGGTLQFAYGNTLDISSRLQLNSGFTPVIDTNGNNVTFANGIFSGGTTGFQKLGQGVLVFAGANTYTGTTTVSSGLVQYTNQAAYNLYTPTFSVASGAGVALSVGGASEWSYSDWLTFRNAPSGIAAGGVVGMDITNFPGGSLTISDALANVGGARGFAMLGAGTITLSGANTYTGATNVYGGRLVLQSGTTSSSYYLNSGATLEMNVATSTLSLATSTLSGSGTLVKSGTGTLQWGGNGTFAFGTGGLIDVQGGQFTGSSGGNEIWTNNRAGLNVAAGATFDGVEGSIYVDALTGFGVIRTGYSSFTPFLAFGVNNGSGTFNGTLAGSAINNFYKYGTGTQVLAGSATYSGTMTVGSGTLQLGSSTALSSLGMLTVGTAGAAVLDLNGFNATVLTMGNGVATGVITDNSLSAGTSTLRVAGITSALAVNSLITDGTQRQCRWHCR
jgi:autotransporter-associated beta strand protein